MWEARKELNFQRIHTVTRSIIKEKSSWRCSAKSSPRWLYYPRSSVFSLPYLFSHGKCNDDTLMRFYIDTHLCTIYIGLVYYDDYPTFYSTVTKNSVELCFAPPLAYTREWHSIPYVLLSSSFFSNWTIISDGGPITPICVSVIS